MTLTQLIEKYPEFATLKLLDVFEFQKTIIGKTLISRPTIKNSLPDEMQNDLREVFQLYEHKLGKH